VIERLGKWLACRFDADFDRTIYREAAENRRRRRAKVRGVMGATGIHRDPALTKILERWG
jgi:hypothetical protein